MSCGSPEMSTSGIRRGVVTPLGRVVAAQDFPPLCYPHAIAPWKQWEQGLHVFSSDEWMLVRGLLLGARGSVGRDQDPFLIAMMNPARPRLGIFFFKKHCKIVLECIYKAFWESEEKV